MSAATYDLAERYRLTSRIAVGGMGEVWRGEDMVLARPVAIKLLRDEFAQDAATAGRFRAEARSAGAVSHPGIAQVYDYLEASHARPASLVMELVDGPSLAQVLASGPLDPRRTIDIVAQVAAALNAAHQAGLVHRDIKPANLLLTRDGQVKITDFGIAYAAGSAPVTRTGSLVGTPAYLAPERVAGGPATPASDLYSLGIVGYECLTGAPPFTAGTPFEVAMAHVNRAVPALPYSVPDGVAALIADLTAKDPANRPGSAGQVARRAGRLREAIAPTAAGPGPYTDATLAGSADYTLVDLHVGEAGEAGSAAMRRRSRSRLVLVVAAAASVAGLVGWLLGTLGATGTAVPPPRPNPTSPTVSSLVNVNAAALVGQPLGAVLQQLRQLGLQPVVRLTDNGGPPGQVQSVQPAGSVPVGSTVIVVARRPHGDHGGGGDQGNGGGGG